MKKNIISILLLLSLFSSTVFCQKKPPIVQDENFRVIDKNIFRLNFISIGGTDADEVGVRIALSYEHGIKKSFTYVFNIAPTLYNANSGEYSLNGFASAELRYYVTLNRRIKKETKIIRNYTAMYFSLEPYIVTNPIIVINQTNENAYSGRDGVFLNTGWQRQVKHLYLNIYVGVHLFGNIFHDPYNGGFDVFHTGLTIGRVF